MFCSHQEGSKWPSMAFSFSQRSSRPLCEQRPLRGNGAPSICHSWGAIQHKWLTPLASPLWAVSSTRHQSLCGESKTRVLAQASLGFLCAVFPDRRMSSSFRTRSCPRSPDKAESIELYEKQLKISVHHSTVAAMEAIQG